MRTPGQPVAIGNVKVAERSGNTTAKGPAREAVENQLSSTDGSLAHALYQAMYDQISHGKLTRGERIREVDIAKRFGVSRTPVREALKRLQAEGLLVEVPGTGLTVAKPTLSEMLDDYLIREVLEGLAARLAAERHLESELLVLDAVLTRAHAAHAGEDVDRAIALSEEFDNILFQMARNPRLVRLIETARTSPGAARRGNLLAKDRRTASLEERQRMLDAVAARDGGKAEKAAQEHLRHAREYRAALAVKGP
jgi:DNA-binding GntR family transcriptional regulator